MNEITKFIKKSFKNFTIQLLLVDGNGNIKTLEKTKIFEEQKARLLECEVNEVVKVVYNDSKYDVYVDKTGLKKRKKMNYIAYSIIGFSIYGNVLFVRKD